MPPKQMSLMLGMTLICCALFSGLIFIGLPCFARIPLRIKVIASQADIRSNPALDAEVLSIAVNGEIYDVADKAGAWYKIKLSVNQSGQVSYGYIHESMVEPLEIAERKKEVIEEKTQRQTEAKPPRNVLSGTSLKFGFGDHWLASLGNDIELHRNLTLGFELEPYYDSDLDFSVVELNFFLNAKLGFRYSIVSVYGGGGTGPQLSYSTTKIEGQSSTQVQTNMAYHLIAGTALNFGSLALIFEFQTIMVRDPAVEPDRWMHFFLIGIKF